MATEFKNDLKKGKNSFSLVGRIKISPNSFTLNKKSEKPGSDFVSNSVYVGVDCGKGNIVYAQMFDGYSSKKKLFVHGSKIDADGKKIDDFQARMEVAWADRFKEQILEEVGDQCFIKIGLQKNKDGKLMVSRYLSAYDAINHLNEFFKEMPAEQKDQIVVRVNGNLDYNIYNGQVRIKKTITGIYLSDATEDKFQSEFIQTIYADKDSIGKADLQTRTLPLSVYVPEYVGTYNDVKIAETLPLAVDMIIDCSTPDYSNRAKYLTSLLSNNAGVSQITVKGEFKESGNTDELDLSKFNAELREAVEAGIIPIEDVKVAVAQSTNRVQILSINSVHIRIADLKEGEVTPITDRALPDVERSIYTAKEFDALLDHTKQLFANAEAGGGTAVAEATATMTTPVQVETAPTDGALTDGDLDWLTNFAN